MANTRMDEMNGAFMRYCREVNRYPRPDTPEGYQLGNMLSAASSIQSAYEREQLEVSRLRSLCEKHGIDWKPTNAG